jgi:hypothetical protein
MEHIKIDSAMNFTLVQVGQESELYVERINTRY